MSLPRVACSFNEGRSDEPAPSLFDEVAKTQELSTEAKELAAAKANLAMAKATAKLACKASEMAGRSVDPPQRFRRRDLFGEPLAASPPFAATKQNSKNNVATTWCQAASPRQLCDSPQLSVGRLLTPLLLALQRRWRSSGRRTPS